MSDPSGAVTLNPPRSRNLVLQPAGQSARANLQSSVLSPVPLEKWSPHVSDEDRAIISRSHPSGEVPMWGTTRGQLGQMRNKWDRIAAGDAILFLSSSHAYMAATITHKWISAALADELWPRKQLADGSELPWELMYSFTEPVEVKLSYSDMSAAAAMVRSLGTRQLNVYGEEIAAAVLGLLGDETSDLLIPPDQIHYSSLVRDFERLDATAATTRRLEQSYLRSYILPGRTGVCALCGRKMESVFLVAAHIKRRSDCTDEEKGDLPAVAMAACKFGCDELYERGLIWVDATGRVKRASNLSDGVALQYWQEHLRGRSVGVWESSPRSRRYFEAHRQRFGHA